MLRCRIFFFFVILLCLFFSELPGSVVWCQTLIWKKKILSHFCFKCFFCSFLSFFSFRYSQYVHITSFVVVPKSLDILFYFSHLCSVCFSAFGGSIEIHSAVLSAVVSSLLIGPLQERQITTSTLLEFFT